MAAMSNAVARQKTAPETFLVAEPWLADLTGKHRQFFDVGNVASGTPLKRVDNFLTAYASAYGLRERDINVLFGAHGSALSYVLSTAFWAKYMLGALYGVVDPLSTRPAERNVFLEADQARGINEGATIAGLSRRGVRLLACNNSIRNLAQTLSQRAGIEADAVAREITESLLPGVFVVPAMLIAGNRAQEAGLTYAFIS